MIELGERLGAGKEAEVFAFGAHAAKIYREGVGEATVRREANNNGVAIAFGLPVPAIHEVRRFGGRWGLVMDRAPGVPLARAVLADISRGAEVSQEMLRLHRMIHAQPGDGLPGLKARLRAKVAEAGVLAACARQRLLDLLDELPDGDRICHGDFHPFNIMATPGATMVIDWLDATRGPPAADVCRSYLLLSSQVGDFATGYVDAYAGASGLAADEIMRWLPVLAAARLAENVPDEVDRLVALATPLPSGAAAR